MNRTALTRFAWLSIATAIVTIALKAGAYYLTGSVGLLSDAIESLVNLVVGVMALSMLSVAARPADETHAFGHGKAEYFSSVGEGILIVLAAGGIAIAAVQRLIQPHALQQIGPGLMVSGAAALINLGAALVILRAGKRHQSITLEANAHHLLTDVLTSIGVIVGVAAAVRTGWLWIDPLLALVVASTIVWTGIRIVRRSVEGLMDKALPVADQRALADVLDRHRAAGVEFHAVRTRQSGARKFVTFHVLVPGAWTVHHGHELLERIELDVRAALPNASVFTHLESLDDPSSWEDVSLDRSAP